jgi:hypothetical protein
MAEEKRAVKGADDEAKAQAIAKMKAAQEAAADESNLDAGGDDDASVSQVKESEIDPTAQKALKDLLGKTSSKNTAIKLVKVYSPFRIYYENPASSVSAVNGTGPFDILPGHKNFLTLLSPGDIKVRSPSGKEETITIQRGVMHVHDDEVQVFLDV